MERMKTFYVILIVFSAFVQLGRLFLNDTGYEKIFKIISSFFVIVIIVMWLTFFIKNNADINPSVDIMFELNEVDMKKEFENSLEQTIEADIHNKFYVNYDIEVNTDFKKLKIYILKKGTSMDETVRNHIISNYCTSTDEVYVINEN